MKINKATLNEMKFDFPVKKENFEEQSMEQIEEGVMRFDFWREITTSHRKRE